MIHHSYSPDPLERRTKRQYIVAIFLPRQLERTISPIREKYDTDWNAIAPHITLVFPFETIQPINEISGRIKQEIEIHPRFEVELNSIGDFYPESPIIFWNVESSTALQELYCKMHTCLDLPLQFKNYKPHVTVAREISSHRLLFVKDKIVSYLPHEKFMVESIDLVAPVAESRWVSVRTFQLFEK